MVKIVEHISGCWSYHLSETGKNGQSALCGDKDMMSTDLPLKSWGIKTHLHEKYCKKCEEIYKQDKTSA
jgi:hypothetical protein